MYQVAGFYLLVAAETRMGYFLYPPVVTVTVLFPFTVDTEPFWR